MNDDHRAARWAAPALALGIVAVSTSGVIIVLAGRAGVPMIGVAFWRVAIAGAVMSMSGLPAFLRERATMPHSAWWRLPLLGALLGLHFALWLQAFAWTDFASNVLLLAFQPLFGALLGSMFFGERFTRGTVVSLLLGAAGLAAIVWPHFQRAQGPAPGDKPYLLGDLASVLSCLAIAAAHTVGKGLRAQVSFTTYLWSNYSGAALFLGAVAFFAGVDLRVANAQQWGLLCMSACIPTLIGHTAFNFAVRYTRLYTVNVIILAEPVLTLLLAALIGLDTEPLTAWHLAGGALISVGVFFGVRAPKTKGAAVATSGPACP